MLQSVTLKPLQMFTNLYTWHTSKPLHFKFLESTNEISGIAL